MIFGKRGKGGRPAEDAIGAFWAWWATTGRARAEQAIAGNDWKSGLVDELGDRISAITPGLAWEFASGAPRSQHLLVVSADGNRELRAVAERWLRAAPDADGTFSFASSRQASPDALDHRLGIDGHDLELSELRFAADVDENAAQIDVIVWHPAFGGLDEQARVQVAFLALDWLLGEDGVEIWIRGIDTTATAGPARTGGELLTAVQALEPHWAMLSGERAGRPLVATIQVPLRAARWPAADTHVRLDVPYRTANPGGLPVGDSLTALHGLEDRMRAYADGPVLVAQEASDGVRTYHLYADRQPAVDALAPIVQSWPEGTVRTTVTHDPGWAGVRHLIP